MLLEFKYSIPLAICGFGGKFFKRIFAPTENFEKTEFFWRLCNGGAPLSWCLGASWRCIGGNSRFKKLASTFFFLGSKRRILPPQASILEGEDDQGDQIGRIFAQWAIVYLGIFFENHISSPNLYAIFPLSINHVLI
jgi:hypothetical protein